MKVYLIQAKLDSSAVHDLYSLLDTNSDFNLQLSGDLEDADVIVTAIRMKKRLERHVAWDIAVSLRDHSLHQVFTINAEEQGHRYPRLAQRLCQIRPSS